MALNSETVRDTNPLMAPARKPWRNDAFSFWKLPDNWRSSLQSEIDSSEAAAEHFLFEHYLSAEERRPPAAMDAYYRVKKFIPASVRHWINSIAVRVRYKPEFPHWPCESALIEFWQEWLQTGLKMLSVTDGWHIGFWPDGHDCCIVLTHDVESPVGMSRMERIADLEEKYGFRSSWNLPLAQYGIDWKLIARLRRRGFEFGAHGLSHDGKLFRSYQDFAQLAPLVERLAQEHDLCGFRAPSTLRRGDWIATMAFDFDMSFSDTDPFEPQAGGTCSLFPFYLGGLVELPYTLPQDHTLIHLLHRDPLQVWIAKAQWISSLGGMILALVHPDYCGAGAYLSEYEELLKRLTEIERSWRALPSEVAAWWRKRSGLRLVVENDRPALLGDSGAARAVARRLSTQPLARMV